MNHLAALIAAVIAALTLTTTPAVADATDPATPAPNNMCLTGDPANENPSDPINSAPCPEPDPEEAVLDPGPKPRDRMWLKRSRSCKHEAKVFERAIWVDYVIDYTGNGDPYWNGYISRSSWDRVLPTPYGCRLNHRAWVKRHGVDGKAVRR